MKTYTVTWEIEVDANTPEEAARKALAIQRDPDSIATVFEITHPSGASHVVDLIDGEG